MSRLHVGQLNTIPWPVIESQGFYQLFPTLKRRLDKQKHTAGEFLHMMRTLVAKLKANDWGALSGLTFFLLGYLRLVALRLIDFFQAYFVGCVGGAGVFLIPTGLAVSARLSSDAFDSPTMETLRYLNFMLNMHALAQWVAPVVLAVLLRCITMRWKHQLAFPIQANYIGKPLRDYSDSLTPPSAATMDFEESEVDIERAIGDSKPSGSCTVTEALN
ncbi:hypothetical protein EDD22DRAFT_959093 [Suillus occidentalis]|nr:hypothetical protein EDD22DRAFT_959093 [Suillus occidentalis]